MKTKEEIFQQVYMTPQDLKILIPYLGINKCIQYMKELRQEMEEKGYFVPQTKSYIVLTKLVRKKFGL